jgi:hypothetical protein
MPISVMQIINNDLRETLHFIADLLKNVGQPWAFICGTPLSTHIKDTLHTYSFTPHAHF